MAWGLYRAKQYGPDLFVEDDVVFVEMNYRLGPLGK